MKNQLKLLKRVRLRYGTYTINSTTATAAQCAGDVAVIPTAAVEVLKVEGSITGSLMSDTKWVWAIRPHSEITSKPMFFEGTRAEAVVQASQYLMAVPGGVTLVQHAPWDSIEIESVRDLKEWEELCARRDEEEVEETP